jgi:hypothetical protein
MHAQLFALKLPSHHQNQKQAKQKMGPTTSYANGCMAGKLMHVPHTQTGRPAHAKRAPQKTRQNTACTPHALQDFSSRPASTLPTAGCCQPQAASFMGLHLNQGLLSWSAPTIHTHTHCLWSGLG